MNIDTIFKQLPVYIIVLLLALIFTFGINTAVMTVNRVDSQNTTTTIIIDPGHGLPDGGATSCTGVLESDLNLEIALRLNDLCHFMGVNTIMTRTGRESIYTEGNTISKKKISDTRNRVKLVNQTDNAIMLSIHQNHFYDSKYAGAQVFYADDQNSKQLAKTLQSYLITNLNSNSKRKAVKSSGIYLMEHINCTGVLIECGFISNVQEENLLRSADYQKHLCAVITVGTLAYLKQNIVS